MAHSLRFTYEGTNSLNYNNGYVKWSPAFQQSSRLYIIHNTATNRPYYIGTTKNLKGRFDPRADVCRELGFASANSMNGVTAIRVQMSMMVHGNRNYQNKTPGDNGMVGPFDAEHLLIRTFVSQKNQAIRNMHKAVSRFTNPTPRTLNVVFVNNIGGGNAQHVPNNFSIPAQTRY
ncbi:MAG: hypothetical protein AAGC60_17315 [Acidobacteriota bacterium]